ncbi:MAG: RDD family protein [bacterium]|nr:RDD family protein [bacterium]
MGFQASNLPVCGKRFLAYMIDSLLVVIVSSILGLFFGFLLQFTEDFSVAMIYILFPSYYIFMFGKYGQTIGYKIVKLKIETEEGLAVSYKLAFYRLVATSLSTILLLWGHSVILFNDKGQALHDKLTNVVVVKT